MKLELNFDDEEIHFMLKQYWYKAGKLEVERLMQKYMEEKVVYFLNQKEKDFNLLLKEALKELLERFKIRDMHKILKGEKKR